jgi:hypothetical protein
VHHKIIWLFAKDHEYGVLIHGYLLNNPNKNEVLDELLQVNSTSDTIKA